MSSCLLFVPYSFKVTGYPVVNFAHFNFCFVFSTLILFDFLVRCFSSSVRVFRCETVLVVNCPTMKKLCFLPLKRWWDWIFLSRHVRRNFFGGGTQILQIPYSVRGIRKLCESKTNRGILGWGCIPYVRASPCLPFTILESCFICLKMIRWSPYQSTLLWGKHGSKNVSVFFT